MFSWIISGLHVHGHDNHDNRLTFMAMGLLMTVINTLNVHCYPWLALHVITLLSVIVIDDHISLCVLQVMTVWRTQNTSMTSTRTYVTTCRCTYATLGPTRNYDTQTPFCVCTRCSASTPPWWIFYSACHDPVGWRPMTCWKNCYMTPENCWSWTVISVLTFVEMNQTINLFTNMWSTLY